MKRVVIVQEHLPHYRQKFYELLYAGLRERGIWLDLVYSPNTAANLLAGSLPWATPVPIQRRGPFAWQNVFPVTKGADLVIVQQESKYTASILLQFFAIFNVQKIAYWGHGRNFQAENSSIVGERFKRTISRFCDWWFAYNDLSVKIVRELGFPADRITSVQNSIDTRSISAARSRITGEELAALRLQLGIHSENIGVFTGGLYREKRLSFLVETCHLIRKQVPDFELIVIGKGPDADTIKEEAAANSWIHYVGPKSDEEKVPYWMLSKLLLMPGLVGLVVLDSFALGVPMVTTNYPYHSPEISYLKDGENGLIVSPWPDPDEYANRVSGLLRCPAEVAALQRNALLSAKEFSVEQMARNFADGVEAALATKKLGRTDMLRPPGRHGKPSVEGVKLGIVIRSLAPYLRDFYDALLPDSKFDRLKVFIGQRGTDWVNPWDTTLMLLRRADHAYVNARILLRGFRTVLPSVRLFNTLERFGPTVLLVYEYSPLSMFAALWAIANRIPWIVATDIGPDYRKPYPSLSFWQKSTHALANRFCNGILALTPSSAKRAKRLGKPYLLCPHAIDTCIYLPPSNPRPICSVFRIIAVGNLIPRKGYDLLFSALARVKAIFEKNWRLDCYGAGSPAQLMSLAEELGISDRVFFSSFLGLKDLIAAYQDSDIFVHPSRSDTYGVVVHEAAACGLPLIVSKFAGASETLVEEGCNGFVVDPDDTSQFCAKLETLMGDHDLCIRFGKRSRELAEKWDVQRNAGQAFQWLSTFQKNRLIE